MTEQTWQTFVNWMTLQERVTFYKSQDDHKWYVEWFNQKGGFKWDSDPDLTTVIEAVMK